jgi:hypothetical protein
MVVGSVINVESRDIGLAPAANNGAGGKGLFASPPYRDDGVPGRGLPFICSGSYGTVDGGRAHEFRDGVHGLPAVGTWGDPDA